MCFSDFSGQRVREGRLNQAMIEKVLKTLITKQSTFAPVGVENHDDDGNSCSCCSICGEIVFQGVLEVPPEEQWVVHNSWGPIYMINELILE